MPAINSPTPDATTTSKGKVQLAGALSGTAASPSISSGVSLTSPSITDAAVLTGQIGSPTTPAAGSAKLYAVGSSGQTLRFKNDGGTEQTIYTSSNFVKTTDTNGWTVFTTPYNTTYTKRSTWSGSQSISMGNPYDAGTENIPTAFSTAIPAGAVITSSGYSASDRSFSPYIRADVASASISRQIPNNFSSALTCTSAVWFITIIV